MLSSSNSNKQNNKQVIIANEELEGHYRFRLRQVGFSRSAASRLASLMMKPPSELSTIERSQIKQLLVVLENRKVTVSLEVLQSNITQPQALKHPLHSNSKVFTRKEESYKTTVLSS